MPRYDWDEDIELQMKAAGWLDYNENLNKSEEVGDLTDLNTTNETLADYVNYMYTNPLQWAETILDKPLNPYQKIMLKFIFKDYIKKRKEKL